MADYMADSWIENSLVRESERGDRFEGVGSLAAESEWFVPKWRNVIRKWYSEVARVFHQSPIATENALFFLDSILATSFDTVMRICDVQLIGLVALFISSKMFGTSPHFKVHDLLRLAPHLRVSPREVCVMELKMIQSLQFNLFVPTTIEFALAFLNRLVTRTDNVDFSEEPLLGSIMKYIGYFESEFSNIEYRQSEKARTVVHCALARWCVLSSKKKTNFTSKESENTLVSAAIVNMDMCSEFSPLAKQVCGVWAELVDELTLLTAPEDSEQRREYLEQFILDAIDSDSSTVYASAPVGLDAAEGGLIAESSIPCPAALEVKLVHIPPNSMTPTNISGMSASFSVVESQQPSHCISSSSSPVDVMNLEEHHKTEECKRKCESLKRIDLDDATESSQEDSESHAMAHKRLKS